ncbi:MAG: NfeD family protein [Clostridia bacterium]|nr:NfeD family protein [Clostridia bacterium]
MLEYMPYIWAAVLVIAIIVESQTMDMICIWFMPSALISMILGMLNVRVWVQCLVFVVLTVVMLILCKTVFKSFFKRKNAEPTNADALIGKEAIITEDVDNIHGIGSAKINGLVWTARAEDVNEKLSVGDIVIVKEIRGVKLICTKKND